MDFKSDLIYPEIKIKEENIETAKLLLGIYTGRNSIINNILTYLYQSSIINEYKNYFIKMIDVELIHAKIISNLINKLGFKPRYVYKNIENYKYYSTSYIYYETDIIKVLNTDLNEKEKLIDDYTELINKVDDNNVKDILKRLVIDEKLHVKIFKDLLTREKI